MPSVEHGRLTLVEMFQRAAAEPLRSKPFALQGDQTITFGEIVDRTGRTAALFAERGVAAGDRIAICSGHDLEVIALYLAALRCGVTAVVIDAQAPVDEARTLVRAAEAKMLFADTALLQGGSLAEALLAGGTAVAIDPTAKAKGGGLLGRIGLSRNGRGAAVESYPGLLASLVPAALPAAVADDAVAHMLFTSGTTSRPKAVEITHLALTAHLATWRRHYGYDAGSRILNGLPVHHTDGLVHGGANAFAAGATLVRTGPFTIPRLSEILGLVKKHGCTHLITVPTVLALVMRLGDEVSGALKVPGFRYVSSTAGPLDEALWRAFEQRFGVMVVNSYGLTETVCEGIYCGPTAETRRIGTIGKPVDVEIRIVDDAGQDVPAGQMGELLMRGDCVMRGYYKAPEETAAVLRDGWLHTGDLAAVDADGFYSIVGRKKNVIITGGINVYPEDVTRVIAAMPTVKEAVTIGVPDEIWGERVVACVVPLVAGGLQDQAVIEHCRKYLAKEKVPSEIFVVDALPRGPVGKVVVPEVRKMVDELRQRQVAAQPTGAAGFDMDQEIDLYKIAAKTFKVKFDDINPDSSPDNTKGWDSLAHVDFMMAVEKRFGVRFSPRDIMNLRSMADAERILRTKLDA